MGKGPRSSEAASSVMEYDPAANSNIPRSAAEAVPPWPIQTVRRLAVLGLVINGMAAALGGINYLISLAAWWEGVRVLLVLFGCILTGVALSWRAELWWTWGLAALTALVGWAGLPESWDSYRLVLGVAVAVALGGALLLVVPKTWRLAAISLYLLFHFGGIFLATTSPHTHNYPAPMVTIQLYTRLYHPYLQFIYMRNAYHFYSPEPGPASLLVFLLRTDTGQQVQAVDPQTGNPYERKVYKHQWVVMPRRPDDVRDPLGLSYYRRLSLTEQLARGSPGVIVPEIFEKSEVQARRMTRLGLIPLHPTEPIGLQYRAQFRCDALPASLLRLPRHSVSYARCSDGGPDDGENLSSRTSHPAGGDVRVPPTGWQLCQPLPSHDLPALFHGRIRC